MHKTKAWRAPIPAVATSRIWFSSHSNRNFTIELPPRLLGRMAALGISLVHDVYQGA